MSSVIVAGSLAQFEQVGSWHHGRSTQWAFALSVALHALFIAFVPGFRAVPVETASVLTVQIVNPERRFEDHRAQKRPIEKSGVQPVVQQTEPLPELVPPPEFVPAEPKPRVIAQTPVRPDQVIEPAPVPVVRQPEQPIMERVAQAEFAPAIPQSKPQIKPVEFKRPEQLLEPARVPIVQQPEQPVMEPVARAEFVPAIPQDKPQLKPTESKRPDLVPTQAVRVPAVAPQPVIEQVRVPVEQPREVQRRPRVVNQQATTAIEPQLTAPDFPQPVNVPGPEQRPVAAAPAAPVPERELVPVVKQAAQPSPVSPPVAKVTVAPAPPSTSVVRPVVKAPAPAASVVDTAVRDAYTESVKAAVTKNMRYPRVAKARGWQGKTVVQMQLSEDGEVMDLKVAQSSGRDVLDEAAIAMVKRSLPLPRPPRGVRTVNVPVEFRLQS